MKTSRHYLFAATFVLLAGLGVSAMAQSKMAQKGSTLISPPEPILSTVHVNAIEVTDGTVGYDKDTKQETAYGYSFLGRTTGSFPGSFTLAMNCTPAVAEPGGSTEMTGGVWTLPVYVTGLKGTGYAGSLFGSVAKGEMSWDKTATQAVVYFVLNIDGGTQAWDGARGYAIFSGTLSVGEKNTTLTGDLVFTIR